MERYMVCSDCIMAIAYGDFTGLDYYYDEEESENRMHAIEEGMEELGSNLCVGDSVNDLEFSVVSCDCCGDRDAGARHEVVKAQSLIFQVPS